jgi:hypothetical protein
LSPDEFGSELLYVIEINDDHRITAGVFLDPEDIEAAYAELDARYLAGEAADHARTWSAITDGFGAFNRGELPARAAGFIDVDHRHGPAMAPGDLFAYMRAAFGEAGRSSFRVETVHRLTGLGAVITHVAQTISDGGLEAEWRMTDVLTVEGNLVARVEMFDDADLDAALARFDELEAGS